MRRVAEGTWSRSPAAGVWTPRRPAPPGDAHTLRAASPPRPLVAPLRGASAAPSPGAALLGGPPLPGNLTTGPVFSSHFSPLQPFLPEAGKSVRRGQVTQRKCRAAAQPLGGGSHIWEGGDGVCPTCIPENCSSRRWFVKSKQRP